MPKSRTRRKIQTPEAEEFLLALETAKTGGSALQYVKSLAEWRFIDKCRDDCMPGEKRYLLEYELAREAEAQGHPYRSTTTWKAVFGSRFPEHAFLSIQPDERRNILSAAFSKESPGVPLFDFTTAWQKISYQFNYALAPEYQAELEARVTEAREAVEIDRREHAGCLSVLEIASDELHRV